MRSIPQELDGILYRSRTEARWAHFFDIAKVPFEYEPEGFSLDGEWYVPDFKVMDVYFEVKGKEPTPRERKLAKMLSQELKTPVVILVGNPGYGGLMYAYGVSKLCTPCCIVSEFKSETGAWLARYRDGGSWAIPLAKGLKNCSATGDVHPLLAEAGKLQFRKPKMRVKKFQTVGRFAQSVVKKLAKGKR